MATATTSHLGKPIVVKTKPAKVLAAELLCATAAGKALDKNAEMFYRTATELHDANASAWNGLGRTLLVQKRFHDARDAFREAMAVDPSNPALRINLAAAYTHLGQYGDALDLCDRVIAQNPSFMPAHRQKVAILEELCEWGKECDAIGKGLEADPSDSDLKMARGCVALRMSYWRDGWKDFESRSPAVELADKLDEVPRWDGKPFEGNLLVVGEQGIGDQIMFARYLPLITKTHFAMDTVIYTRPELVRLLAMQAWLVNPATDPWTKLFQLRFVTSDREVETIDIQRWIPLGSLPHLLSDGPPIENRDWLVCKEDRERMTQHVTGPGIRVGLAWQGNPAHRHDKFRSIQFEQLRPLLDIPGCSFYSLQIGDSESGLPNLTNYCHDLGDTAAAIQCLDLVITVDSAIAHLAGSLGKETWMLNYLPGDWRWGAEGPSWYPSLISFRQAEQGQWGDVIEELAVQLERRSKERDIRSAGCRREPAPAIVTKQCRYGEMSFFKTDHYISRGLDLYGEFSESEVALFRRVLKSGDTVIEAGGNIGCHATAMGEIVGPKGKVWTFEPNPTIAALLKRNCASRPWIEAHDVALGVDASPVMIKLVDQAQVHTPSWPETGETIEVACISIDSLELKQLAFLKNDTDGPEFLILQGAEKTIERCRPVLYVEVDKPSLYPDMIPWIADHGYRPYNHFGPLFNPDNFAGCKANVYGKIVSAMLLCIPRERYDLSEVPREFGMERVRVTRK